MKVQILTCLISVFLLAPLGHAQEKAKGRSDWEKIFSEFDAHGTIVVADARTNTESISVYDEIRAQKRYSPASTFKIPHTLFALDAGIFRDEFQVFKWDGVVRSFAAHNQDQDLQSAMRNSAVAVYPLPVKIRHVDSLPCGLAGMTDNPEQLSFCPTTPFVHLRAIINRRV